MKTYQTLALTGGIFGIIMVPILVIGLSVGLAFLAAFDADPDTVGEDQELFGVIGVTVAIISSVSAIILVYKSDNTRIIGYALLGMAIAMAVTTHVAGVISWAFFAAAGISALRYRD